MFRRFRIAAAAVLLSFSLSSCVPFLSNVEDLMQPPKLTDLQAQVDNALRSSVDGEIQLKYPRRGEYRSAFTFLDLDNDGDLEAIALYSGTDGYLRLAVLTTVNDQWVLSDTLPSLNYNSEVDFIRFDQLVPERDRKNLMIGWTIPGSSNNILTIYEYSSSFNSEGHKLSVMNGRRFEYSQVASADLNGDGANELLLFVAPDSYDSSPAALRMLSFDDEGEMEETVTGFRDRNISRFMTPVVGMLDNVRPGVVVDCYTSGNLICSVAVEASSGRLTLPLEADDSFLFRQTYRQNAVPAEDINGDGIIDLPVEVTAPGYETEKDNIITLTQYTNLNGESLDFLCLAYVNLQQGYRFVFPSFWIGHSVSVKNIPYTNETLFYFYSSRNKLDDTKELLRLKVVSSQDSLDPLDQNRYFQLASKGSYLYSAYIPQDPVAGLSITPKDVLDNFSLIA